MNGGIIHQTRIQPPTALDTYLQRLPMIFDKIEALRQLADDHFGHEPDAIHWGHVGDLERMGQALDDLLAIFDGQAKEATRNSLS